MRKYSYWLLIGALIFIIVQDPTATGDLIRQFFSWIGEGIGAMFEFIASVLGQDPTGGDAGTGVLPNPVPSPTVTTEPPAVPSASSATDQALGLLRSLRT